MRYRRLDIRMVVADSFSRDALWPGWMPSEGLQGDRRRSRAVRRCAHCSSSRVYASPRRVYRAFHEMFHGQSDGASSASPRCGLVHVAMSRRFSSASIPPHTDGRSPHAVFLLIMVCCMLPGQDSGAASHQRSSPRSIPHPILWEWLSQASMLSGVTLVTGVTAFS